MPIITARVVRIGDSDTYDVQINHDGAIVVVGESYAVASAIAHALTHPEDWEPTEAYEVAAVIQARYTGHA